jgi:hypothetical protein
MLLRQGMAVRGHTEPEGNLQQLLTLRTEDVPDLSRWLADGNYLSHDTVNELITLMGNQLLRTLLEDIREAVFFFQSWLTKPGIFRMLSSWLYAFVGLINSLVFTKTHLVL